MRRTKRKSGPVTDVPEPSRKQPSPLCILHTTTISDHGSFISFSSARGDPGKKLAELHNIRDQRLTDPTESSYRMKEVGDQIPTTLEGADMEAIGYHRRCYQNFTSNLQCLKCNKKSSTQHSKSQKKYSPRKQPSAGATKSMLFPPECIFCIQLEIKVGGKTERIVKFQSWNHKEPAWKQVEPRAKALNKTKLHRRVENVDLFAAEATYHPSCRNQFNTEHLNHMRGSARAQKHDLETEQDHKIAAHQQAYSAVKEYIRAHIIESNEVLQLSSLRHVYMSELEEHGAPSPDYRGENLMKRLQGDDELGNAIVFSKVSLRKKGCLSFYLVYSTSITLANAVAHAYKLGTADQLKDVALILRGIIMKAFKESPALPWPPTADDLDVKPSDQLPEELVKFLNLVLGGTSEVEKKCEKTQRLVFSIAQDLCRATTNGEWKLPKHILLCTTVRHLYRSKQLTTILNKLSHSESYDFGLELETAMAKAIDEASTYLTPQIICGEGNEVFHTEWDNLNKITTNVHGSNVINSAGGIMIQEVKPGFNSDQERTLPLYDRSKDRSLKINTPETLPPLHIYNRVGPKFPAGASFSPPAENKQVFDTCMQEYYVWLLCRVVSSHGKQQVPGFGGFISATGQAPLKKSTIDYFTPINQPITENSVVQELLRQSEAATAEVGQKYTINTFDLGVCMKALPLIWKFPEQFKIHIVLPGQFHTGMNYIGMITGHKCRGSGYTEILFEAKLATSGCLKSVLSGKAYSKALFCLKTVCEALERLLLEQFIEEENVQIKPEALLDMIKTCEREKLDLTLKDPTTLIIIRQYLDYQGKVRKGHLGKTAVFWLSVMDHSRLGFMLIFSVKTNNLPLFHKCNGDMADLFFAYDGQNYSRFLLQIKLQIHLS